MFKTISKNTRGASMVEYGALLALIGVLSIGMVLTLGSTISHLFSTAQTDVSNQFVIASGAGAGPGETGGTGGASGSPSAPDPVVAYSRDFMFVWGYNSTPHWVGFVVPTDLPEFSGISPVSQIPSSLVGATPFQDNLFHPINHEAVCAVMFEYWYPIPSSFGVFETWFPNTIMTNVESISAMPDLIPDPDTGEMVSPSIAGEGMTPLPVLSAYIDPEWGPVWGGGGPIDGEISHIEHESVDMLSSFTCAIMEP